MLNILLYLALFTFSLTLFLLTDLKTMLSLFLITEIYWITIFTLTTVTGSIYDDIYIYSLNLVILLITAVEAGLFFLFFKFFKK